jgi:hypothetical protein
MPMTLKERLLSYNSVGSLREQQLVKNQDHHKEMIVPRLEWRSRFLTLLSPHLHNSTKLPQNRRTKKLYWKKILEGLDKFFKESMLLL